MEARLVTVGTWLTRRARPRSLDLSLLLVALLVLGTFAQLQLAAQGGAGLSASGERVFGTHEYWRAFTALFAHGDLGHLLGNVVLFLPFSYFLAGYFPRWFFPGLAFLCGAAVNLAVLATMPPATQLLGVSGVVYWMGAAWLALYLRIERREPLRRRLGKLVLITAAIFVPETIKPEVSYLSHLLGFVLGALSGSLLYRLRRHEFLAAEARELRLIPDSIPEEEWAPSGPPNAP